MSFRWAVPLLLLAATTAAGEEPLQVPVEDTPPVDRIVLQTPASQNRRGTRFTGDASLFLDDGTEIAMTYVRILKRKRRRRPAGWFFRLRTPRRVLPAVSVRFRTSEAFDDVTMFKFRLRRAFGTLTLTDASKVTIEPVPEPEPEPLLATDLLALHDQNLTTAGLGCQATGCHENQMQQFAPHKDAGGNDVVMFHYLKASLLRNTHFGGRTPEQFQDRDCTVCHKRVRLLAASGGDAVGDAAYLRRWIDTEFCASCHETGGPAKTLYQK